uniref:Uncharacterized protein n=1 Tax=Hucho hucho TaxID=62062 RepID=A0A4W5LRI2_9TELE
SPRDHYQSPHREDWGRENFSKQRLLSAHFPFLPPENNLTLTFEIKLKMLYVLCVCACVFICVCCLDRRRVGVELEDSSVGVPILQFHTYTL